jgi:MFS transporter, UMF1 family
LIAGQPIAITLLYTSAAVGNPDLPDASDSRRREAEDGASGKASRLAVWSWVLYDFSNTIFSISILTYFFPVWLGDELGAGPSVVNFATAISALFVVFTAPLLGAIADLRQKRLPYLAALTVLAVLLTAGLDLAGGVLLGVALFVAADVAYQSALVFYNALLPGVSAGRGAGRISGYGTAAGYVGTILALVVLPLFVAEQSFFGLNIGGPEAARSLLGPLGSWIDVTDETSSNAFLPTAILYLVFSLPAFFFVPDPAVRAPRAVRLGAAYRDVVATLRTLGAYAGVGMFILATVLYMDAANTAVANMALYGREVFGMDSAQITNLLLFSTVFAIVGSVGFGLASDNVGPKKALVAVLVLWLVAILLAASALAPWMLFVAGPLVGIALGGTWTVSRVMLVALSPPEKLGEFFGLFSLAGKVSAVAGPAVTALLLWALDDLGTGAYRIAVGSLSLIMAVGLLLLLRVPDARPDPSVEEFAEGAAGIPK